MNRATPDVLFEPNRSVVAQFLAIFFTCKYGDLDAAVLLTPDLILIARYRLQLSLTQRRDSATGDTLADEVLGCGVRTAF